MGIHGLGACGLMLMMTVGCGSASNDPQGPDAAAVARAHISQRITGVWRLQSYVPESSLSPAMLLGMQSEKIVVHIQGGRVRSANRTLTFDRAFRIANVQEERFTLFISDDTGVEYESACELDTAGRLLFYSLTAPWRGRGVLEREGGAMAQQ
ncbi:MAG: hypothetical protein JRI68_05780 [Deltaproteobacteria bacterium]|nr:hypothetical protein [Deltaproteobacteria bacterium]